jgi:hypothetical protein
VANIGAISMSNEETHINREAGYKVIQAMSDAIKEAVFGEPTSVSDGKTRAFTAGFSAGVHAGLAMDANDVDASTEPYIVEAIERAMKEQRVDVVIDHDSLTSVTKLEEGMS